MCVVGLFIFIFSFILGEGELVVSMEREMPTLELLVDWLCTRILCQTRQLSNFTIKKFEKNVRHFISFNLNKFLF